MKPLALPLALAVLLASAVPALSAPGRNSPPEAAPAAPEVSLVEAAMTAGASGAWRAQNTARITTGRVREDDRKRSALAFAISGAAAFVGAGLWRWLPCRESEPGVGDNIAGLRIAGYNKCYDPDGNRRPFDTPTKLMLGAGVLLELVSLGYYIAHVRGQKDDDDP